LVENFIVCVFFESNVPCNGLNRITEKTNINTRKHFI
jgi:hypothetical protein